MTGCSEPGAAGWKERHPVISQLNFPAAKNSPPIIHIVINKNKYNDHDFCNNF